MKKLLCSLLVMVILFNFILTGLCYGQGADGVPGTDLTSQLDNAAPTEQGALDIAYEGRNDRSEYSTSNFGASILGAVLGYVAMILDIIPFTINILMTVTTEDVIGEISLDTDDGSKELFFTVERAVFNRFAIANINYFDTNDLYTIGSGSAERTINASDTNNVIKTNVAKWFVICRLLALVIGLLVLIYIGINMAISTIASDKAKYKKMLVSWAESVVILFVLQYIMVALINIGEIFSNICVNLRDILLKMGLGSFEMDIMHTMYTELFTYSGLKIVMYSIIFWFLVFIQLKFFLIYMKRFLMVGFLIAIAPLITITYSIDKIGDNRAQAFSLWIREFMVNVFIQPLHAIIYLVFVFTAGEIAIKAPVIGLVFLLSLGRVEKMVKTIFSLRDMVSLRSVDHALKKGK